jgi:polyphosphate glucokinase
MDAPKKTAEAGQNAKTVLAIDLGGSHVKVHLSTGGEKRAVASGPDMSPDKMVKAVREMADGWEYDVIGMGYPGPIASNKPSLDPHNLAAGWNGYDFEKAFGKPLKLVNDALMQAIGSYDGGRMLFLGLGTGLGAAMVVDKVCLPMELAHLPYKKNQTFEDYVGFRGLKARGKSRWRKSVDDVARRLKAALQPDYIVIGGGNVDKLKDMPADCRRGSNENAFAGGFRIWLDPTLKLPG